MPRATPKPRSPRSAAERRQDDGGTGLIPTIAGVTVFLAFLLLAVQLLFNLYATSAVTAAAYDAARVVAGQDGGAARQAEAEEHARRVLGRYAERVSFAWTIDDQAVRLRVRARQPRLLLGGLGGAVGLDEIDRTVRVRVERLR